MLVMVLPVISRATSAHIDVSALDHAEMNTQDKAFHSK